MEAYRTEAVVEKDGSVVVRGLPFQKGERVEVIVLPREHLDSGVQPYPLKGSVFRFDNPFDPAATEDEWEALGGRA